MQKITLELGRFPRRIKVEIGSEFISKVLDKWAYLNHVMLDFSNARKAN